MLLDWHLKDEARLGTCLPQTPTHLQDQHPAIDLFDFLLIFFGALCHPNFINLHNCTSSICTTAPSHASLLVASTFALSGPQILHVDTGTDILDLLSQESWERWKAQAERFRKATPADSEKFEKDTKDTKNGSHSGKNSFLSIFRCGRSRILAY